MGYSAQIGLTMPDAQVNTGNIPKSNARETPPYGDTNTQGFQHGQLKIYVDWGRIFQFLFWSNNMINQLIDEHFKQDRQILPHFSNVSATLRVMQVTFFSMSGAWWPGGKDNTYSTANWLVKKDIYNYNYNTARQEDHGGGKIENEEVNSRTYMFYINTFYFH